MSFSNMDKFVFDAADEAATATLGAALAGVLSAGATVALCGTLGAGKTQLVRAIAEACGIDRRDVVSPTFVLIHEYHGRRTIYHMDAYRVASEEEFAALGPDEYFESGELVLVEWADRVASCLPANRIEVCIEVTGPQSRRFEITAIGPRFQDLPKGLAAALGCER